MKRYSLSYCSPKANLQPPVFHFPSAFHDTHSATRLHPAKHNFSESGLTNFENTTSFCVAETKKNGRRCWNGNGNGIITLEMEK